ncbi:MAG: ATP-binding protein, partial [Saprospiraceae bacterium]|nr:ATP-binding protein [Saprospiraceae bacterium]
EIQLDVDSVVPIGLIVNELITNSIKYAFGEVDLPKINLELRLEGSQLKLHYQDNGPGFDRSEIDTGSIGMRLIRSFSNRLQADTVWHTDGHTMVDMSIHDFDLVS